MKFWILALFAALWTAVFADEEHAMSFIDLPSTPDKAVLAGQQLTFRAQWIKKGLFESDLPGLSLAVVRDKFLGQKYEINKDDIEYGDIDASNWRVISFPLPSELKSGKYYLLWETNILGDNEVISPKFYVTTLQDLQRQQDAELQNVQDDTQNSEDDSQNQAEQNYNQTDNS